MMHVKISILTWIGMSICNIHGCNGYQSHSGHGERKLLSPTPAPTPAQTAIMDTWSVGVAAFAADNIMADGEIGVEHIIGPSAEQVSVTLYDWDCVNEKNSTGLEVWIQEDVYTSSPFTYSVMVDESKIGSSPGGFISYLDEEDNLSEGTIALCTRVSTISGGHSIVSRRSNFHLHFDLTQNIFSLETINIEEESIDNMSTEVGLSFGVEICQCDDDYTCYSPSTSPVVKNSERLVVCIYPTSDQDASIVHIGNFNLDIVTSDGLYSSEAVALGAGSWEPSVLTDISLQDGGNTIKVSTVITAQFYTQGYSSVNVEGNAFLEFDSGKIKEHTIFERFGTMILLEQDAGGGCFRTLFRQLKSFFL